jgi:hypothetical protein
MSTIKTPETELGSRSNARCCHSLEESFGAQILVEIWPVYSVAASRYSPIPSLFDRRVEQAWIPSERNGDNTAVFH